MSKKLVVKNNDLIEARYNLTLNEQKVILYAVSKLDRDKSNFNVLSLEIREFFDLLNTTKERYTEIRSVVHNLRKKELVIKKGDNELVTGWLSSIEHIKNEGRVELEFSEKLIPYLLQLKQCFTRYELKYVLKLKRKHTIRIYELLKQYETIGKREFSLKELRMLLDISDDEYTRFDNFDGVILKNAKKGINLHTDLNIDYKKLKTGRKITSILFKIEAVDKDKKVYIEYLNDYYDIKKMKKKMGLRKENFNTQQIMDLYEKAVEKIGNDDIDVFEYIRINYIHIKRKARNKYAYLLKALENDYASARGQISMDYYIE